jgi:hypothetical protein
MSWLSLIEHLDDYSFFRGGVLTYKKAGIERPGDESTKKTRIARWLHVREGFTVLAALLLLAAVVAMVTQ